MVYEGNFELFREISKLLNEAEMKAYKLDMDKRKKSAIMRLISGARLKIEINRDYYVNRDEVAAHWKKLQDEREKAVNLNIQVCSGLDSD